MKKLTKQCSCIRSSLFASLFLLQTATAVAMEGEFSSWINLQTRYYTDSGAYVDEKVFPAVAAQFEYQAYVGDADQLSAALFMRYDQEDEERRYLDVRELLWRHDNEYGRIQAGVGQVAWGVNEFFKITDVVNQKDRAELPLPKKLGQPLIGGSFYWQDDLIELYTLYDVREAWYPGEQGRLRFPILVDNDEREYDRGETGRWDFAGRYKTRIGEMDFSLSHFYGVTRDPYYIFNNDFNNPKLIPVYEKVNQTSLELVYPVDVVLLKFEATYQMGGIEQFESVAGGIEYAWGPVFETDLDLTLYAEAIWDSRDHIPTTLFDHDIAIAGRIAFNDSMDTFLMIGTIVDYQYNEAVGFAFINSQLADGLELNVGGQYFYANEPGLDTSGFTQVANDLVSEIQAERFPLPEDLINLLISYFEPTTISRKQFERIEEQLRLIQTDPDYLSQVDLTTVPQTLFDLLRISDNTQKLNLIERDSYLQLDLIYRF